MRCAHICIQFFCDLVDHQAPLSLGFFRQKYWSELPFPSPGDLHNTGIKPLTLTYPALVVGFFIPVAPSGKSKAISYYCQLKNNKVFIYLFMLFLADLHCFMGFSLVAESEGCLSSCGGWASHCGGFSCCRA